MAEGLAGGGHFEDGRVSGEGKRVFIIISTSARKALHNREGDGSRGISVKQPYGVPFGDGSRDSVVVLCFAPFGS